MRHSKKVLPFARLAVYAHPDSLSFPRAFAAPSTSAARARRRPKRAAGVRGKITRYVTTIPSPSSTYHFYELDVSGLDGEWLEAKERRREWVDYAEAMRRLVWKQELAQGLSLSTLAPRR